MNEQLEDRPVEPIEGASESLLRRVSDAIKAQDRSLLENLVQGLRPADLAELLELMEPSERIQLIEALGSNFNFEVLSELDETVRDQISEALPNEVLAKAVTELDTDDAAYLIENLEEADKAEILAQIPVSDRTALQRNLDYPEESAGRLMQSEFVAVPPFWTVGRVIDYARQAKDLPETFTEIFVVDPTYRVLGTVDLSHLLRSAREIAVESIMDIGLEPVLATADQEEVAARFRKYDLMSAPVVDDANRLVGVITVDDIVEIIHDEADEDMLALGGVGDESVADNVLDAAKSRVPWLLVNLGTAILASLVIKQFDATIEQMVALAALMPIVASMGGNAGTQAMTITVRALAVNKLGPDNARRIITREALVALLNGTILSCVLAGVVLIWFGSGPLGLVIASALIVNILTAGLVGILIPLALNRLDLDPAPASGILVTAITDVVGFFVFLSLASLLLL